MYWLLELLTLYHADVYKWQTREELNRSSVLSKKHNRLVRNYCVIVAGKPVT